MNKTLNILLLLFFVFSCDNSQKNKAIFFDNVYTENITFFKTNSAFIKDNINLRDSLGKTALLIATEKQNIELVKLLIQHNANPSLFDKNYNTPLSVAKSNQDTILINFIKETLFLSWTNTPNKFTEELLLYAIKNDLENILSEFLRNNYSPDFEFSDTGIPLLIQCIFEESNEALNMLLNNKANPNITFDTRPALSIAAMFGNYNICSQLLAAGANPNETEGVLTTALMFAAEEGNEKIVQLLLSYHADITMKDLNNQTAYDKAIINKHTSIAQMLKIN